MSPPNAGDGAGIELPFRIGVKPSITAVLLGGVICGIACLIGGVVWVASGESIGRSLLLFVGGGLMLLVCRGGLLRVPRSIVVDREAITWSGIPGWRHVMPFDELERVGLSRQDGKVTVIGVPRDGVATKRPSPPPYDREAGVFTLVVVDKEGSKPPYDRSGQDIIDALRRAAGARWVTADRSA